MADMMIADVIIAGNGPAGISAALYTVRAGLKTLIIGRDTGALERADRIENYYGFLEPVKGADLVNTGIAQAKRLGAIILHDEVVGLSHDGQQLTVKTKDGEYRAASVILATGSSRNKPKIEGLAEYEGLGVSYCAVCDGFFYQERDVAVLGSGEYALSEALELLPIVRSVTMVTNGEEPISGIPADIQVLTQKITKIGGSDTLSELTFSDGTTLPAEGLFVAAGIAGSSDLAKKLGAYTEGTKIVVNEDMAANVPGLFAAGDCTGGMLQIAKAVYEGAKAGTEAVKYCRQAKAGTTANGDSEGK